ncbi:MAG: hypothetical protein FWD60_09345 [Candidatus Azobacteroides sp.]|nr:hypothetical protein [Candidatus Azobacteroides sp.]
MKKIIIYQVLISLLLVSCSTNKVKNDLEKEGLKGKVKSVQSALFNSSEQLGETVRGNLIHYDDLKSYNEKGYLIEIVKYWDEWVKIFLFKSNDINSKADIETYHYNDKNLLTEIVNKDIKTLCEYNEKNQMIQSKLYDNSNGQLRSTTTFIYDEYGNPIESIDQSIGNSKRDKTTFKYEYDNNHHIIKSVENKLNDYSIIKEFNKNNNLTVERKIVGKVDSLNNLQEVMTEENLYTYNDKNQLIKEFHKNSDGTNQIENHYGKKGLLISSHDFGNSVNTSYDNEITYEYDSHDNWIKKIYKYADNSCRYEEREINYYNEPEKSEFKDLMANMKQQRKIEQACNVEVAAANVNVYMNMFYPDWKICTEIKITSLGDCKFNAQFQVIDPHMKEAGVISKEQIVAELDLSVENYTKFNFKIIRGTMY